MKYGPLTEQVEGLIRMTDMLTGDRIDAIVDAFHDKGRPVARFSEFAARRADRWAQTHAARQDMALGVVAFGLTIDADGTKLTLAMRAAGNAGLGMATEDLIGTMGYTSREYASLVDPWFAGFPDVEGEQ
jgi:hypothetical protein